MSSDYFRKETHIHVTRQLTDLCLDVYVPLGCQQPKAPSPILLWFHGGYLITGSRLAVPGWLLNDALRRGWIVVSPDYRVLPESTGLATIEDLHSAYEWVSSSLERLYPKHNADTSQIIIGGASAGGWCAVVSALRLSSSPRVTPGQPCPKALLLLYPAVDLGSEKWAQSISLPGSAVDLTTKQRLLEAIPGRIARQEISVGEDFPTSTEELQTRKRLRLLYAILHEGIILNYLTGICDFAEKCMDGGLASAVRDSPSLQQLFPLDYGKFGPCFPPTIIVHGTADNKVSSSESEALVTKLEASGASVQYFPELGAGHVFDLGWEQPNTTLELALHALQASLGAEAGKATETEPTIEQTGAAPTVSDTT